MKIAWVMGDGGHRLVVDFIPKGVSVGVGRLTGYDSLVPMIVCSYSVDQLQLVLPALQEMKKLEIAPKVHIWNRTKKSPELRVEFRIPCAGNELLARFAPDMHRVVESVDAMSFTAELCVASSGNGDRDGTETFFRRFNRIDVATVVVCEDDSVFWTSHKHDLGPYLHGFAVTTIGTKPPSPLGLQ